MEAETQVINGGVDFDDYIFGDEGFADPLSSKDGHSPLKPLNDILNRIEDLNAVDNGINHPANNEQLDLFSDPAQHTKGSNKTTGPNRKSESGDKLGQHYLYSHRLISAQGKMCNYTSQIY